VIFATVGTQLPFPRLMTMLDRIAGEQGLRVIAQTCDSAFRAVNLQCHASLAPGEFDEYVKTCRLLVSHAGIGSILTARKYGKPIVIMPRQVRLGEHRNDHQMATARQLGGRKGIYVVQDDAALRALLSGGEAISVPDHVSEAPLAGFLRAHLAALGRREARVRR
jgi:UDP-N-acetylglucosamine transferase subunit ALG13